MGIDSSQISIVVQGAVMGGHQEPYPRQWTARCLDNLRCLFPQAEIILSTWPSENTAGLSCDKIVVSCDPGAIDFDTNEAKTNNGNRQIISTLAGLREATRKYVFKVRSDLVFGTSRFLDYFGRYTDRCDELKVFKERILVMAIYTKKCSRFVSSFRARPFHVSDWISFGLKEDMLLLWDIPLGPEPLTSRYFQDKKALPGDQFPQHLWIFSPEQSNWVSVLSRVYPSFQKPLHKVDNRVEILRASDLSIANNFVVLDQAQFMVQSQKLRLEQHWFQKDDYWQIMRFCDWQNLYRKYCSPKYIPVLTQTDWIRTARDILAFDFGVIPRNERDNGGFSTTPKISSFRSTYETSKLLVVGFVNYLTGSWLPLSRLADPPLDRTPRRPIESTGIEMTEVLEKLHEAAKNCSFIDLPAASAELLKQMKRRRDSSPKGNDRANKVISVLLENARMLFLRSGFYAEVSYENENRVLIPAPISSFNLIVYSGSLKEILKGDFNRWQDRDGSLILAIKPTENECQYLIECFLPGKESFFSGLVSLNSLSSSSISDLENDLTTIIEKELIPRCSFR